MPPGSTPGSPPAPAAVRSRMWPWRDPQPSFPWPEAASPRLGAGGDEMGLSSVRGRWDEEGDVRGRQRGQPGPLLGTGSFCAPSSVQRGWRSPGQAVVAPTVPLSVPHTRWSAGIAAGSPSRAARGWGTGQCQLRAEAAPWMWQHGPGDLCPTLGTCPVSLLCPCHSCPVSLLSPCKPTVLLGQPPGTARPAMPLCIHRPAPTGNVCPVARAQDGRWGGLRQGRPGARVGFSLP